MSRETALHLARAAALVAIVGGGSGGAWWAVGFMVARLDALGRLLGWAS